MSDLENRIKKLEQRVDALEEKDRKPPTLVLLEGDPIPEGTPPDTMVVFVGSPEAKLATEAVIRGDCTE